MAETLSVDGLLPPEIAHKVEDIGALKARLPFVQTLMLAILAGAFVAMGAVACNAAMTGTTDALPYGLARLVGGLAFCLGLILVVVAGAELFTGNNLLVMAWVGGKLPLAGLLRNWGIVYVGNFVGSVLTAALIFPTETHTCSSGGVGLTALKVADAKCALAFVPAFTRGIYCNALVCLAVWLAMSCRSTGDKILAVLFPTTGFVMANFEHSVANMYFIPMGLLIKGLAAPSFWTACGSSADAFPHLTLDRFLLGNLLPVTIGNVIGGGLFVGAFYWVIYCRRQGD